MLPGRVSSAPSLLWASFHASLCIVRAVWLHVWSRRSVPACTASQTSGLCVLQSTKFMLGIIIAVICSNWVGEAINSDGVYETDLEADGTVIFLRPSPPHMLYTKTAADIAARAVWCDPWSQKPLLARAALQPLDILLTMLSSAPSAKKQSVYMPMTPWQRTAHCKGTSMGQCPGLL